jgi:putative membrane protein insertion efficiency factor
MTNDECQMAFPRAVSHSSFGFRHSLVIRISSLVIGGLTLAIRVYQITLSPVLSFLCGATGGCRYTPTCSAYAVDALREHGAVAGSVLAAKRICRCHPWGGCGHDPVPRKNPKAEIRSPKFI